MDNQREPIKKSVERILRAHLSTRDSDMLLIYYVYRERGINTDKITATQLLERISKGEIPPPDSVTRYRRMAQEDRPELRGKNYEIRARREETIVAALREGEEVPL